MQRTTNRAGHHHAALFGAHRTPLLFTAALVLAVLAAGCGSNSPSSGVAHLGSSTQATSSTAAGAAAGSSERDSSPGSQAIAYAACMRSHGVPNFPDPKISHKGSEVSVRVAVPAGSVPDSPQFKGAEQACRKLAPGGGGPGGTQSNVSPKEQAQYLRAAACIRSHGIPNFPDPTFSGGGVHIQHQGLNESSPVFKAAVHACESLIPGGAHGGGGEEAKPEAAP